jgi:hypothetical protein
VSSPCLSLSSPPAGPVPDFARLPTSEDERQLDSARTFWSRVKLGPSCWKWMGYVNRGGYGKFRPGHSATVRAHRFAWQITFGPIPPGLIVCHRCDNPGCVRPEHLFLGTHLDNKRDSLSKGRSKLRPPGLSRAQRRSLTALLHSASCITIPGSPHSPADGCRTQAWEWIRGERIRRSRAGARRVESRPPRVVVT